MNYKLLTPGPLTTTESVKQVMQEDHCTWDEEYKEITQKIRRSLLALAHADEQEYTAVLMQGSGTFGVESVLTGIVGKEDKLLIIANGAYGKRMTEIAEHAGLNYSVYDEECDKIPDAEKVGQLLDRDPCLTHVAMVHGETTSGILNDIQAVGAQVKSREKVFIADAMSTFGGVDIPVQDWGIDFLISSANKCIQGVPGFSFIRQEKTGWKKAEERQEACLLISMNSGKQWKRTESGDLLRRPILCWHLHKRCRNWSRKAAFRPDLRDTGTTTAFLLRR